MHVSDNPIGHQEPVALQVVTEDCYLIHVLVREHSATSPSACWATVGWSRPEKWNWCVQADLHFKEEKNNKISTDVESSNFPQKSSQVMTGLKAPTN